MILPPSIDFETYSEAGYIIRPDGKVKGVGPQGKGGPPVVGTPVYFEHPSADVLSAAYDLRDGKGPRLWVPGAPNPLELFEHVERGGLIEAWNATFEFWAWNMVCHRRYGWPQLAIEQCRCVMAKSRRYSLPGSLDAAAAVLGTARKDKAGGLLINRLTRPVNTTKYRRTNRRTPATDWDDFKAFYDYNLQDVVAEDEASARIPDMTPYELETWLADQRINARGVQVDTEALDAALDLLGQVETRYAAELSSVTGGAVNSASEVAAFVEWLSGQGVITPDLQKKTVSELLGRDLKNDARRALEIREILGSANVKKLRSIKLQTSSDGRLRNQYMCWGADRTGRWAAGGVQLQNITAKGPRTIYCSGCGKYSGAAVEHPTTCPRCLAAQIKVDAGWPIEAVEHAIDDIKTRSLGHVESIWGNPIDVLCGCLRGMFVAAPGCKLVCCDFSAIEAVVAACVSRCDWRIKVFETPGECIYTKSASKITGTPLEVYKRYRAEHNEHHEDRKKIGKIAELASGYGGWVGAWKNFGADKYFSDDEIKQHVLKWRDESPEIVNMWGGQYVWCGPGKWDYRPELHGLEGAAILAIQNPGTAYTYIDITYYVSDDVLHCVLPSGRHLYYHRPRLQDVPDKLNRGPAVQLTFEGYNSNPLKGSVGWIRIDTYGGKLFENVVQATAGDIQSEAIKRLEVAGYPVVMHTHDEATCEVPDDPAYSVEAMRAIMEQRPAWAQAYPIRAAGWEHRRYQKD